MRQTAAIALLALRNALRSRVVLVLFLLLLAASVWLPRVLRGDGTPEGLIRIHLAYVLGLSAFLLTLATLWAGCAAIAQEADDKTLQLLLVKPVPRLRIWLGKWLALLLINAVLLAFVGAVSAATLHRQLRRGGFDPAALAAARQTTLAALDVHHAPLPDVEADVETEYRALRDRGALPAGVSAAAVRDNLRRTLRARRCSVAPGASLAWDFGPFATPPGVLLVQFKCDSSVPGAAEIDAALRLRIGGQTLVQTLRAMPGAVQTAVFGDLPPGADGATVVFENHGAHGATLFFDPAEGLVLRQPAGTFAGNLLRALAALWLRLALFAALGVALGTFFSMPVATFLAAVLVLILQLSGFISAAAQVDRDTFVANVAPFGAEARGHGEAAAAAKPSRAARAAATGLFYVYRGTFLALRPLLEDRTLDALSTGVRIPPRALARGLLVQGLLWPAALAFFSTLVLRRREWALPEIN